MPTVVWTPRARADLAETADYHAERSPGYADLLVRRLLGAVARLATFPHSGRTVPELEGGLFREVIYRNYRIVYLYDAEADRVEVLSVFHSSRPLGGPPGS